MKNAACRAALLLAGIALSPAAHAASSLNRSPQGFGLGVVLGDPTGLSFAWRPNEAWLVQAHVGWSLTNERLRLSADYLWNFAHLNAPGAPALDFVPYVGVGGRARIGDDDHHDHGTGIGVRVPVGMAMLPSDVPIDVFLELAPVLLLFPDTDFELDGGLGARFYF